MLGDRIKSVGSKIKKITENPTFAAVAGVVVGFALGAVSGTIQHHDAVTYNNISSYIESLMVSPGLIDKEILLIYREKMENKKSPFEITNSIIDSVTEIAEFVSRLTAAANFPLIPHCEKSTVFSGSTVPWPLNRILLTWSKSPLF